MIFDFKNAVTLKPCYRSLKVIETGNIQQIGYGFLLMLNYKKTRSLRHTVCEILTFAKYCDLETEVRGHKRSLKMTLFDTLPMTSCWCSIVTIWLYVVRFMRHLMSKNIATLKSRSRVNQGHWRWYHSIDCLCLPLCSIVTVHKFFVIFNLQLYGELENQVKGHSWSSELTRIDTAHKTSY